MNAKLSIIIGAVGVVVLAAILIPVIVIQANHVTCPPSYSAYVCEQYLKAHHPTPTGATPTPTRTATPTPAPSPTPTPSPTQTPGPTPTPSPTPSPTPPPPSGTCNYKPPQASVAVNQVICEVARQYNLPRWWLYAIVQRESSFNPSAMNARGDRGLTQFGHVGQYGQPYPYNLAAPNNSFQQWIYDMGINKSWGGGTSNPWVRMTNVTRMDDWAIAREHMHRFASLYAVPAYNMIARRYGISTSDVRGVLDRMAFHWNTGLFSTYDPNWEYMPLYRQYVDQYRGPVEAEDGVWVPPPSY